MGVPKRIASWNAFGNSVSALSCRASLCARGTARRMRGRSLAAACGHDHQFRGGIRNRRWRRAGWRSTAAQAEAAAREIDASGDVGRANLVLGKVLIAQGKTESGRSMLEFALSRSSIKTLVAAHFLDCLERMQKQGVLETPRKVNRDAHDNCAEKCSDRQGSLASARWLGRCNSGRARAVDGHGPSVARPRRSGSGWGRSGAAVRSGPSLHQIPRG
jgi:hypothetical protein